MTTSLLNDCLLFKDQPPEQLIEHLKTINLTIFNAIISKYPLLEAKQTILFILTAYSEDSPLLILRQDATDQKEGICEYLNIPEYLRGGLLQLTDPEVRKTVTKYIADFSGPLFRALKLIEIQLDDLNMAITNREYTVKGKAEGEDKLIEISLYDWKEHAKAVQQFEILSKKKDAMEKELKNQFAYKAITELKEYKFHNLDKKIAQVKDGVSIESNKRIKIGM